MIGTETYTEPTGQSEPAVRQDGEPVPPPRLKRLLVATAGESNAEGAVRIAALLAQRHAAEVSVVSVFQPPIPYPIRPGEEPRLESPQRFEMSMQISRVRQQLAVVDDLAAPWSIASEIGERGRSICQEADRRKADLIVLGLGREAPGERELGDRALLQVALCVSRPLLAVCPTAHARASRVLLAVGRDHEVMRLAELTAAVAAEGAVVHLVHVTEPGETSEKDGDRHHMMSHVAAELERMGLHPESHTLDGRAAGDALLEYANTNDMELIVGGLHGEGFTARSVVRNAAMHLAAQSPCSVLLVPRAEP